MRILAHSTLFTPSPSPSPSHPPIHRPAPGQRRAKPFLLRSKARHHKKLLLSHIDRPPSAFVPSAKPPARATPARRPSCPNSGLVAPAAAGTSGTVPKPLGDPVRDCPAAIAEIGTAHAKFAAVPLRFPFYPFVLLCPLHSSLSSSSSSSPLCLSFYFDLCLVKDRLVLLWRLSHHICLLLLFIRCLGLLD